MTMAQQLRNQGMQQGRQEGFDSAMQQAAKNMLAQDIPVEKISQITGIPMINLMGKSS